MTPFSFAHCQQQESSSPAMTVHSRGERGGLLLLAYNVVVIGIYALMGVVIWQVALTHSRSMIQADTKNQFAFKMELPAVSSSMTVYPKPLTRVAFVWHPSMVIDNRTSEYAATMDPTFNETMVPTTVEISSSPDDTCLVSQCTPLQRLETIQYRDLQYLFTGSGLSNISSLYGASVTTTSNSIAICEFRTMDAFSFHFPHTMQQLYRCWSWWRLHVDAAASNAATTTMPVLVFPRGQMPKDNAFLTGFVATLVDAIGLQLVSAANASMVLPQDWRSAAVQPRVPNNLVNPQDIFAMQDPTRPYFAFHQVDDAFELRRVVRNHIQPSLLYYATQSNGTLHRGVNEDTTMVDTALPLPRPRIAILNRQSTRQWLNAPALVTRLHHADAATQAIPIVYFHSNTTFAQQVDFFAQVDILISPHGAQLTGIAFMPPCGAVLEILPAGYYLPHYFGSLAWASHLEHAFVSLTRTGNVELESMQGMRDQETRQKVRNKALCPDLDPIAETVNQLIVQWQQRCVVQT
jgi:Glycosyltransferase 61